MLIRIEDIQFLLDRAAVQETVMRVGTAIDLKDCDMLRGCFLDAIMTDYSDLRGEPPAIVAADKYVEQRKESLTPLKTQHLSSNHLITIDGDNAQCASEMVIYRRKETDTGMLEFNTHCYYEHKLQRTDTGWKINSIKQIIFWNEGDASIHSGARQSR